MKLGGGCHCRSIRYELEWPAASGLIPARRCGCSFCTRFNGTWTSHPQAILDVTETASRTATRYRFGTGTADFLICAACGVVVVAITESAAGLKAVLNINTLDEAESLEFDYSDSDFGSESVDQRMSRRNENWIGSVHISQID